MPLSTKAVTRRTITLGAATVAMAIVLPYFLKARKARNSKGEQAEEGAVLGGAVARGCPTGEVLRPGCGGGVVIEVDRDQHRPRLADFLSRRYLGI